MLFVRHVLEDARRRLAVLNPGASVADAARALADRNVPLAIVCDGAGLAVGVISKIDVIERVVHAGNGALDTSAEQIMTAAVFTCRENETLQSVWEAMSTRGLRSAPVLDDCLRPLGVLHARDVVRALLEEVNSEEVLLRDYVLGVGYR